MQSKSIFCPHCGRIIKNKICAHCEGDNEIKFTRCPNFCKKCRWNPHNEYETGMPTCDYRCLDDPILKKDRFKGDKTC